MDHTDILKLLEDPEISVVSIDPPSVFQKGHPRGCINIPLTRVGWLDDLAKEVNRVKNPIVILSSQRISAEAASKMAMEDHIDVKGLICGTWIDLEKKGVKLVKIPAISVEELKETLDSYTVIDVRNSNELVSGYIQGAIHIPLHRIKEGKFNLEKEKKYVTVCAHGIRSRMAANVLIEKGYDAKTVTGGMAIWLIRDFEVDYP